MEHEFFMKRCFDLALRGSGQAAPNPLVGAVLVHNGRIIAEGWHHGHGLAHAEVDCLDNVADGDRERIRESTMYVNLEPCAHHGKTPPCAHRLVREQVGHVVIANTDPFEQVQGRGISILREGGVSVTTGVCAAEGEWLNRRFFTAHTQQRPYIILKWAKTADGYIAPRDGSRFQITNDASQQLVHKWRSEEAAIMVGTNTAINDDPQLTARLWQGRQPLRVVLDRELRVPESHKLFAAGADTWLVNEQKSANTGHVRFLQMPFDKLLLPNLLAELHRQKVLSVIVEGGSKLLDSFLQAELWDEARVFTGALSLGGGIPAPLISDGELVFQTTLESDKLELFYRKNSHYGFVAGMPL